MPHLQLYIEILVSIARHSPKLIQFRRSYQIYQMLQWEYGYITFLILISVCNTERYG